MIHLILLAFAFVCFVLATFKRIGAMESHCRGTGPLGLVRDAEWNRGASMRLLLIPLLSVSLLFASCVGDQNTKIKSGVETAATFAIKHVPAQFQTQLANYLDVAAKGVYSIDGTPTVNEVVQKVMSFIPAETQKQFPFIGPTISTAVSFAYVTYGKPGLTSIGQGLEAAAAPYRSK